MTSRSPATLSPDERRARAAAATPRARRTGPARGRQTWRESGRRGTVRATAASRRRGRSALRRRGRARLDKRASAKSLMAAPPGRRRAPARSSNGHHLLDVPHEDAPVRVARPRARLGAGVEGRGPRQLTVPRGRRLGEAQHARLLAQHDEVAAHADESAGVRLLAPARLARRRVQAQQVLPAEAEERAALVHGRADPPLSLGDCQTSLTFQPRLPDARQRASRVSSRARPAPGPRESTSGARVGSSASPSAWLQARPRPPRAPRRRGRGRSPRAGARPPIVAGAAIV